MKNRKEEIKQKGFKMTADRNSQDIYSSSYPPTDFSKIKVGLKTLEDAVVNLGDFKKTNPTLGDKNEVLRAINQCDYEQMRNISNYFFRVSGIYSRLCRYMANLYRYDWWVIPYINSENIQNEKITAGFYKILTYLDNFNIKKFFGEVSLKVLKNGCYYGYLIQQKDKVIVQELDPNYCRTRYSVNGKPAIEFNMRFFDDEFTDAAQRMKILNLFPSEFKKGYVLYKQGKLPLDFIGDTCGWYLLDINSAFKFNINGDDAPAFIPVIPDIIDLNEAQELDRKKMKQKLLKIIIQKMPLDKNGDLVFDVDEAQQLHNNAVQMLGKAIGIDVLTTFADVDVADMADKNTTTSVDELSKVERTVYNEAGVSQMQFNTDGNIALEKSILNDEAALYNLISQYESFLNEIIELYSKNKKIKYKVQILPTTIYNYKDLAKLYKEQTQIGYSKILPQLALGQSQSSILASAYFENEVLELVNVFIPPMNNNTMSSSDIKSNTGEEKQAGRKELPDDEKTEKTIQNKESMN